MKEVFFLIPFMSPSHRLSSMYTSSSVGISRWRWRTGRRWWWRARRRARRAPHPPPSPSVAFSRCLHKRTWRPSPRRSPPTACSPSSRRRYRGKSKSQPPARVSPKVTPAAKNRAPLLRLGGDSRFDRRSRSLRGATPRHTAAVVAVATQPQATTVVVVAVAAAVFEAVVAPSSSSRLITCFESLHAMTRGDAVR